MENIKVNRITVNINQSADETVITLYKTNEQLGIIITDDLELLSFRESGLSTKGYQAYCKDFVINLIDNGGIEGYYYEPKTEVESQKYDMSLFRTRCKEYIDILIEDNYEFHLNGDDKVINIEQYKDKYIKDITAEIGVTMPTYNIRFHLVAEIKSGQMCRPRIMLYNDNELSFNITNINKIVKSV